MRIAIVVPGGVGADGIHGVIPALLSLVERLAARHQVLVVATEQAAAPEGYLLRGAQVVALGGSRRRSLGRIRICWRAFRGIRAFRPDVIHALWLGPGSTLAVVAGRLLAVPVVASVGGGELVALPRIGYGGWRSRRGRWHAGLALGRAAAVTAGSRSALAPVLHRRPDARWLPLGVERLVAEPRAEPGIPGDPVRLLVAASVNRVKGPEVILGALVRLREELGGRIRLDWIGEDTIDGSAGALARALGVAEIVAFRGFRPHDEVLGALREADLLVQGSHHESQGVAVLEAAMAGVPTVGTAVGLAVELAAEDPPAAEAVPVGDAAALARAIVRLAHDVERRTRLGVAARAWALAHDADWTAAGFESLYSEVVERSRGRA